MPGTTAEMVQWVCDALDGNCMPDDEPVWADGTSPSDLERSNFLALLRYEAQRRADRQKVSRSMPARRRAFRLLRRFLTPFQREMLNRQRCFMVEAPSGRYYRFIPCTHAVQEIEKHGSRWYVRRRFCIHPEPDELPAPDVTLVQLLMLAEDEENFRRTANITEAQIWDRSHLRRVRERRQARLRGTLMDAEQDPTEAPRRPVPCPECGGTEWSPHGLMDNSCNRCGHVISLGAYIIVATNGADLGFNPFTIEGREQPNNVTYD